MFMICAFASMFTVLLSGQETVMFSQINTHSVLGRVCVLFLSRIFLTIKWRFCLDLQETIISVLANLCFFLRLPRCLTLLDESTRSAIVLSLLRWFAASLLCLCLEEVVPR